MSGATNTFEAILPHYSAALDEIHRLRMIMAYEARVHEAALEYKTFPKSRRTFSEASIERLRSAARGEHADSFDRRAARIEAQEHDIPLLLTRHDWENDRVKVHP